MQFGLFTVLVLVLMDIADSSKVVKGRRHKRRSTEVSQGCGKGCEACSEVNGCIKCLPRLFILLERNDIRQIGVCLQSCPPGYYGDRSREINKCTKCRVTNCENCFSRNFCTKCNDGFYLHKGVCYSTCPEGFIAANGTMECSSEQCEMSEWGSWSQCFRPAKQCWKKKGTQTRSRKVLIAPLGEASLCPVNKERRKCTMLQTPCPKGELVTGKPKKENQGKEKKNRNRNKEESGNKKRKNQQRVTSMPITPSLPAK
ncbi:PREDICTED: R-spondin-1 isoform X2 [Nanorana parkeri]|uniref:R-spondin-1 isoform X2 n=1 Tax=Nanorana parkeri TaxID=125878 RepID=UPI0008541F66|nr:PREDICTED: R-spondin-1 isoform X2 [Nanorana parkeri]